MAKYLRANKNAATCIAALRFRTVCNGGDELWTTQDRAENVTNTYAVVGSIAAVGILTVTLVIASYETLTECLRRSVLVMF